MCNERQQLRDSLDPSDTAAAACIAALDAGATFRVFDGITSRDNLVAIYARRVEHLIRKEARTVGSADLVRRLRSAEPNLRLAAVDDDDWHFVVFLSAATGDVVCVWGVDAALGNPEFEG